MSNSLQRRLLYTYMSVILVLLIAVGLTISILISDHLTMNREQLLLSKGQELAVHASRFYRQRISESDLLNFINGVDASLEVRVWVLDNRRNLTAISGPADIPLADGLAALSRELNSVYQGQTFARIKDQPVYNDTMMIVGVPVRNEAGQVEGAVLIHSPMGSLKDFLTKIYLHMILLGLFTLILTLFIVDWLSTSIAKPLKVMEETASALAHGDYDVKIDIRTDDEIGQLGRSLNALAKDLKTFVQDTKRAEKLRRDFIANVSHELRTPITIIRGYNEALMDYGTVTDRETTIKYLLLINDETIRLERLVKDLLDLSRLQAGNTKLETEAIPLHSVSKSVVTMLEQQAEQKQVTLRLGDFEPVDILASGDRLIQLLVILIDNAIRYTPAGGEVTVSVTAEEPYAVLTIKDTGVGIPQADLPYIWERFYKVDKAHTRAGAGAGTGIGLALAREIIQLHGAKAEVESRLGHGTVFRILFQRCEL